MTRKFQIYCHSDTDGGIAAAIYARYIWETYGWESNIEPVSHGQTDWSFYTISAPCAILDFTMHPAMLTDRFYSCYSTDSQLPKSAWIDHHPTGVPFSGLDEQMLQSRFPHLVSCWDTKAISTPGLFRTHSEKLGLSGRLIEEYSEFIDQAEIIDGALYADPHSAHDFYSQAIKLQSLFSSSHPSIHSEENFKRLVHKIIQNPDLNSLFDSDPLFSGIIEFEKLAHLRQKRAYEKVTKRIGKVALSKFLDSDDFHGLGRFIPYVMFPEVEYAIHVMPEKSGMTALTCGINPWNKPVSEEKHLGHYFAKNFSGGGHSFSAGGKIEIELDMQVEQLIQFLNS